MMPSPMVSRASGGVEGAEFFAARWRVRDRTLEATSDGKSLHLGFLAAAPRNPNLNKLAALKTKSERFELIDRVFYLHAPDGIGKSKVAANTERLLGVPMTDRNWQTVCKLHAMVNELK